MSSPTPDGERSDEELMRELARGELSVIREIYMRHGEAVLRFLFGTMPDAATAEDLCQETFLEIPRAASGYREQRRLRSWLIGIAAHKARSWRRHRWLRETLIGEHRATLPPPRSFSPEDISIAKEDGDRVRAAMAALPAEQRAVLMLQLGEKMSGADIADTLGVSHATVRVRLHRAKMALLAAIDGDTTPWRTS